MTAVDPTCPACGGAPTDDSVTVVKMADLGYIAAGQRYECKECGEEWR